jgi:hypothetical protein
VAQNDWKIPSLVGPETKQNTDSWEFCFQFWLG